MKQEEIEKLFTHHAPTPDQIASIGTIRAYGAALATCVVMYVPEGADQAAAIRKIREAVMTANAGVVLEDKVVDMQASAGETIDVQANAWGSVWGWIKKLFGAQAMKTVSDFEKLVASDLLPLAEAAVQTIEAKMQGAAGADKLAAAKTEFITAAKAAGQDVQGFAISALNCFIEVALQAVLSRAAAVATAAIAASSDEEAQAKA